MELLLRIIAELEPLSLFRFEQCSYDYWVGNLQDGSETRHEVLLGFAESTENKALFTEMTGLA